MASIETAPSLVGPRFSILFLLSFPTFLSTSGTVTPATPQHGDHCAIEDFGRLGVHSLVVKHLLGLWMVLASISSTCNLFLS